MTSNYLNTGVFLLILFLNLSSHLFSQGIFDPNPERFQNEIDQFKKWDSKNNVPKNSILFVGSSSIRFWKTAKDFPDLPVINRGFGGAHIPDILYYFDTVVAPYNPSKIIFYCGDNDITAGKTPVRVASDFQQFLQKVHQSLPDTRVIYLAAKPSPARWIHYERMAELNKLVDSICKHDSLCDFTDTATPLLDASGHPDTLLFLDDGIHLNDKGYQRWKEVLLRSGFINNK